MPLQLIKANYGKGNLSSLISSTFSYNSLHDKTINIAVLKFWVSNDSPTTALCIHLSAIRLLILRKMFSPTPHFGLKLNFRLNFIPPLSTVTHSSKFFWTMVPCSGFPQHIVQIFIQHMSLPLSNVSVTTPFQISSLMTGTVSYSFCAYHSVY